MILTMIWAVAASFHQAGWKGMLAQELPAMLGFIAAAVFTLVAMVSSLSPLQYLVPVFAACALPCP